MDWIKCRGCGRVLPVAEFAEGLHQCKSCAARAAQPDRRKRNKTAQADSVAKWREKTGNAYGKAYSKARAQATAALIDMHPGDFKELMDKARIDHDLGPSRGPA